MWNLKLKKFTCQKKKKNSTTPLAEEFGNKFEGSICCNTFSNSLKAHCIREFDEYSEVECKTLLARRVCKPVWGLGKGLESLDEYEGSEKVSKVGRQGVKIPDTKSVIKLPSY